MMAFIPLIFDLNRLATNNIGNFDVLNYAGGINNSGWITGYGVVLPSGQIHAFVAKPFTSLTVRFENGKVILTWDAAASDFVQESSSSLGAGANWLLVTTPSEMAGGQIELMQDIIAG